MKILLHNRFWGLVLLVTMCYVMPVFGEVRENWFGKFHLCSDALPNTESVPARSKLVCAAVCSAKDTCTACSYLSNGTCNLHYGDLTPHTCPTAVTASAHFQKLFTTPTNVCQNGGTPINNNTACQCQGGYVGNFCERLMIDCSEGKRSGHYPTMSGFYQARPTAAAGPIQIRCDTYVDHIVLMHWMGDVDFNVTRADYVSGFGGATADYWVGLENLHLLTSNAYAYTLGVQVSNVSSNPFYQHYYQGFKVKGDADGYSMTFTSHFIPGPPASPMGDCLTPLMNIPFSAYDSDNDGNPSRNCAADYGGGWWYNDSCSDCNLMGELRYYALTRVPGAVNEVFWLPGLDPADFSPNSVNMFLYR